jgi:glycine cleavage system transcriptional repressor
MRTFALTAVGRDRPGIVAAVSGALLAQELNIEDSQMSILRGHFAMTLIVAAPDELDADALRTTLDGVRADLSLDAVSLNEVTDLAKEPDPVPSHMISVYGADHPGIVHAVSSALAERGWTITDLATRLVGEETGRLYAMMIEVALPEGAATTELEHAMGAVGEAQGVEITSRPLDQDPL